MNLSAYNLTERHMGREVTADGLTGTLAGLLPCSDRITLVLTVGGARAYKTVPSAEPVIVVKAAS